MVDEDEEEEGTTLEAGTIMEMDTEEGVVEEVTEEEDLKPKASLASHGDVYSAGVFFFVVEFSIKEVYKYRQKSRHVKNSHIYFYPTTAFQTWSINGCNFPSTSQLFHIPLQMNVRTPPVNAPATICSHV